MNYWNKEKKSWSKEKKNKTGNKDKKNKAWNKDKKNKAWNKDKKNTTWNKEKKNKTWNKEKKGTKWTQSLRPTIKLLKQKKIKKSLQYLLLLKKFKNIIDYKNIKLLKVFLTKYGKIRPRRNTYISVQNQHIVAKTIRKSRVLGLLPFTCDVKI